MQHVELVHGHHVEVAQQRLDREEVPHDVDVRAAPSVGGRVEDLDVRDAQVARLHRAGAVHLDGEQLQKRLHRPARSPVVGGGDPDALAVDGEAVGLRAERPVPDEVDAGALAVGVDGQAGRDVQALGQHVGGRPASPDGQRIGQQELAVVPLHLGRGRQQPHRLRPHVLGRPVRRRTSHPTQSRRRAPSGPLHRPKWTVPLSASARARAGGALLGWTAPGCPAGGLRSHPQYLI